MRVLVHTLLLMGGCHLVLPLNPASDGAGPDQAVVDAAVPDTREPDLPIADLRASDAPDLASLDGPLPDLPTLDLPTQPPDLPFPDLPPPDLPVLDAWSAPDGPFIPKWIQVAAGTFTMGASTNACSPTYTPVIVKLTHDFLIWSTEVSQADFNKMMGYLPTGMPSCTGTGDCPVSNVNWHQAAAYCNALSASESIGSCYVCTAVGSNVNCGPLPSQLTPKEIYTCPGYRLPTEAEWEYAYRAKTTTDFYNGNYSSDPKECSNCTTTDATVNAIGWYCANYGGVGPQPVGMKQPNAWGIHDMAGNLYEWCHDWYDAYPGGPATNPAGPASKIEKVARGGAYNSAATALRAVFRSYWQPTFADTFVGFRCVRSTP